MRGLKSLLKLRGGLEPIRETNPHLFAVVSWYVKIPVPFQNSSNYLMGSILDVDSTLERPVQNSSTRARREFQTTSSKPYQQGMISIEPSQTSPKDSSR
jgi:hypothetical protein